MEHGAFERLNAPPKRAYFFGCVRTVGHSLISPAAEVRESECSAPWRVGEIDQAMQPGCTRGVGSHLTGGAQLLGVARLHHRNGWTMLSCWDRSVDSRPGSNANFMIEGKHDFETMLALVAETFPGPVILAAYDTDLAEPGRRMSTQIRPAE